MVLNKQVIVSVIVFSSQALLTLKQYLITTQTNNV